MYFVSSAERAFGPAAARRARGAGRLLLASADTGCALRLPRQRQQSGERPRRAVDQYLEAQRGERRPTTSSRVGTGVSPSCPRIRAVAARTTSGRSYSGHCVSALRYPFGTAFGSCAGRSLLSGVAHRLCALAAMTGGGALAHASFPLARYRISPRQSCCPLPASTLCADQLRPPSRHARPPGSSDWRGSPPPLPCGVSHQTGHSAPARVTLLRPRVTGRGCPPPATRHRPPPVLPLGEAHRLATSAWTKPCPAAPRPAGAAANSCRPPRRSCICPPLTCWRFSSACPSLSARAGVALVLTGGGGADLAAVGVGGSGRVAGPVAGDGVTVAACARQIADQSATAAFDGGGAAALRLSPKRGRPWAHGFGVRLMTAAP